MHRIVMGFVLLALLHLALPAAAELPPPATAAPAPPSAGLGAVEAELRERTVRLDESLKARQDEIKRLQDDQAKLKEKLDAVKEQQDGFWTPLGKGWIGLAFVAGIILGGLGWFYPGIKKRIEEEGVARVLTKLGEDDRLLHLFESHVREISRMLLARSTRIWIEGDADEAARLDALLTDRGFKTRADTADDAELIVLVGLETCAKRGEALLNSPFVQDEKPLVLLTGAEKPMNRKLLDDLSKATFAVAANSCSTAVMHVASLAMLAQRPKAAKKTSP